MHSSETNSGSLWDAAKIRSSSFSAGKNEAKKWSISSANETQANYEPVREINELSVSALAVTSLYLSVASLFLGYTRIHKEEEYGRYQ